MAIREPSCPKCHGKGIFSYTGDNSIPYEQICKSCNGTGYLTYGSPNFYNTSNSTINDTIITTAPFTTSATANEETIITTEPFTTFATTYEETMVDNKLRELLEEAVEILQVAGVEGPEEIKRLFEKRKEMLLKKIEELDDDNDVTVSPELPEVKKEINEKEMAKVIKELADNLRKNNDRLKIRKTPSPYDVGYNRNPNT